VRRLFLLAVVSAAGLALAGSLAASDRRAAASADLSLEVPIAPSTGKVGSKFLYTFTVDNEGPDNAGGVLTIELPPSFERTVGTGANPGGVGCDGGTTIVRCHPITGTWSAPVPGRAFGDPYNIWVRPAEAGTFTVRAKLEGDVPDPNLSNNEVSVTTTVSAPSAPARVSLTGTVGPGQRLTLTKANGSRVRTTKAGLYAILVRDRTAKNNFHLTGKGVNKKTGIAQKTTVTWQLALKPGLYRYRSDATRGSGGTFRVT